MVRKEDNDTSTSSDSSLSKGNCSNDSHHAWFEILTEDEKFKWKFPKDMANLIQNRNSS